MGFLVVGTSLTDGNEPLFTLRRLESDFHAHFGCSPDVCEVLWRLLEPRENVDPGAEPEHLLWMLGFMKIY